MVFKNVPGTEFTLECDLVLLAMGFVGPERSVRRQLGVKLTDRGTVWRDEKWMTSVARRVHGRRHAARPVAHRLGDCRRPQRARGVDQWLMGQSQLPAPLGSG